MITKRCVYLWLFFSSQTVFGGEHTPALELHKDVKKFLDFLEKKIVYQATPVTTGYIDKHPTKSEVPPHFYVNFQEKIGRNIFYESQEEFPIVGVDMALVEKLCDFCNQVLAQPSVLARYQEKRKKKGITMVDCWQLYTQELSQKLLEDK